MVFPAFLYSNGQVVEKEWMNDHINTTHTVSLILRIPHKRDKKAKWCKMLLLLSNNIHWKSHFYSLSKSERRTLPFLLFLFITSFIAEQKSFCQCWHCSLELLNSCLPFLKSLYFRQSNVCWSAEMKLKLCKILNNIDWILIESNSHCITTWCL